MTHRGSQFFLVNWRKNKRLGELTVGHAVPAISSRPDFAAAGGLLSYGADDEMSPHRSTGIGESVAYLTSIE